MASILLGLLTAISLLVWTALPPTLNAMGLHPEFSPRPHHLQGHRALIVTTSQAVLAPTDKATGVWASELTAPYYAFSDGGMEVDLVSIQGGEIPFEPGSTDWPLASSWDQRFLADPALRFKASHASAISEIDFSRYEIVFLAGGWGAAYDLGKSEVLGQKLTQAYGKGVILGGICHGPLGLLKVKRPDGKSLVAGLHLTAVSDKQVAELGIDFTPQHPERELRAAGALYEKANGVLDVLANHLVVDGRVVTGQNQNAGSAVADQMMVLLDQRLASNSMPR